MTIILEALRAKVDAAWEKAGEAVVDMVYHRAAAPSYNPTTGAVTQAQTTYPVKVIRSPQSAKLIAQNTIQGLTDMVETFKVRNTELPADPNSDDWFMHGSVKYPIRQVIGDGLGLTTDFIVG